MKHSNPQSRILTASLMCGLCACVSYQPQPLPDWSALTGAAAVESADELTLSSAVAWMLAHNQRLSAARSGWRTALALAEHPTPVANPSFSIGPVFLSGANTLSSSHQALEAALGWVIPLSGVREATDALHDAAAKAARTAAVVVAREEYLALRGELLALAVQIERARQARTTEQALRAYAQQQRLLGAAGRSRIDLNLAELEAIAADSQAAGEEASELALRGAVARRCGAAAARIADLPARVVPDLPVAVPSMSVLLGVLEQHPDLVELRADYELAERVLRREVRKQYPDLAFGGGYEREAGVNRFVLPLGIDLPIFDRNQQGIAEAGAQRTAIRQRYATRVQVLRRAVELARELLLRQQARHVAISGKVERLVRSIEGSVEALVRASRMGGRERARIFRRLSEARSSELDARDDVLQAWSELERAGGAPLLALPGQPATPSTVEVK